MAAVALDQQGSNRFQLVNIVPLPGKCAVCGYAGNERLFLDFGFQLDYYGAVAFCVLCVEAAAQTLGYASPEVYDVKIATIRELKGLNENLVKENNELRDSLATLIGTPTQHVAFDESSFVESISEPAEPESGSTRTTVEAEPTTDEQGSSDIIESILGDGNDDTGTDSIFGEL